MLDDSSTSSSESLAPITKKAKREPCFLLRLLNDTLSNGIRQAVSRNLQELDSVLKEEIDGVLDFWSVIGNSLLKGALESGVYDLFELLLKYAAKDRVLKGEFGAELIRVACSNHAFKYTKLLLDLGVQMQAIEGDSLLMYVYGDTGFITLLLEHGAPVNDRGDGPTGYSETCLIAASRDGDLDLMKILVKHGADPNSPCDSVVPPLVLASFNGDFEAVQLLLDNGADINAVAIFRETRGGTAMSNACAKGYVEIARLLLERGADPVIPDQAGRVPLDYVPEGSAIALMITDAQLDHILK